MTKDWVEGSQYKQGDIVRKMDSKIDNDGKTIFYNIEYFVVEEDGIYEDTSGFRKLYAPYYSPGADYNTIANEDYVVVNGSKWREEYVFSGNMGKHTSGNYPSHFNGVEWVGDTFGREGLYLEFIEENIIVQEWEGGRNVEIGDLFTFNYTKVFEVTKSGQLSPEPIQSSKWLEKVANGTSEIRYVGSVWVPGTWLPEDGVALVYSNPGYSGEDFGYNMYKVLYSDGTVYGDNLLPASGICLDGGITWMKTDKSTDEIWKPNYGYSEGDIANINSVPHEVVNVQKLNMGKNIIFDNIIHKSKILPYIFTFSNDIEVDGYGDTKVVVNSLDYYTDVLFGRNNFITPNLSIVENYSKDYSKTINELLNRVEILERSMEEVYLTLYFTQNGIGRWDLGRVNLEEPTKVIGRLEIINNNEETINFNFYESYDYGNFNWISLKDIELLPGERGVEYIQLSGDRNDFVCQTYINGEKVDTSNCVLKLVFSDKTNETEPTIICP